MPFVFTARGRVHLSPTPLPPPNFAPPLKLKQATTKGPVKSVSRRVSSSKLSREPRRTLADIGADGDSDSEFESSRPFDENHPFVTSNYDDEITSESEEEEHDSDGEEDIDAALNSDKWNEAGAFEQYLAWFMGPPPDVEEEGIPSSSSPIRSSSPPSRPSSAFDLYSPPLLPAIRPLPQHEIQVYPCAAESQTGQDVD
ncbi:hypothetical protein K443DRAFT_563873 [Laccaria amethystina LaAM-08-1]|uniref:Uncharacterized protein n=1 Tax=Laccaria amethystina LaAM-08-1 TaxID=1095629 RepID=A0A0C9WS43_9AGAR|nr:hypothetical protein K443DRAFT_563873 [Laccaria amethystina LaAM-08-1]